MSARRLAIFTGLGAALLFWLAIILNMAGGRVVQLFDPIQDFASIMLVAWALALMGSIALRARSVRLSAAWGLIAPLCSLLGAGNEVLALHQGMAELAFPEGNIIGIFAPRLAAAVCMLGATLLGLTCQLALSPRR